MSIFLVHLIGDGMPPIAHSIALCLAAVVPHVLVVSLTPYAEDSANDGLYRIIQGTTSLLNIQSTPLCETSY